MFLAPIAAGLSTAAGGAAGLAAISTAATIGAGVLGTVAQVQQAKFEQRVAEQNATTADENRIQALRDAAIANQDRDFEATQELGALIARQAASGLSGGSHALQRKTLHQLAQRDRQRIATQGEATAARFGQQAQDFRTQASAASARGSNAVVSGVIGAGTSLISGAQQINEIKARSLQ